MDINALIKDLFYCKGNLQEYINRRYRDPKTAVIILKYYDYLVMKDGNKFYVNLDVETVGEVLGEYQMHGITKEHTVIDLGANVGGFTVPAARLAKKVIAYEPMRYNELKANVDLNGLTNVEIHSEGIGDGNDVELVWREETKVIKTVTFEQIVAGIEGPCFLKLDTEGSERFVPPEMLSRFDRIEAELHWDFDVCRKLVGELSKTHVIEIDHVGAYGIFGIIHATRRE